MTSFFRTLVTALLFGVVAGAAFVPHQTSQNASPKTIMHFKFLKDMGLEKPSWLPDFGGGKEEEPEKAAVTTASSDSEDEDSEESPSSESEEE